MLSSLSFYERDCKKYHASCSFEDNGIFQTGSSNLSCAGDFNEKNPYGFSYGSGTTEFLNSSSVKVNKRHGNTFPKVFPL